MGLHLRFWVIGLIALTSCKEGGFSTSTKKANITGTILNAIPDAELGILSDQVKSIALKADGTFVIDTLLPNPTIINIVYNNQVFPVFVDKGDAIKVTLDPRQYKNAPKFEGDHASENNFLLKYEEYKSSLEPQNFEAFFTSPENEFIASVEKRSADLQKFIQDYQQKSSTFSQVFSETLQSEVDYEAAQFKMNYPEYYSFFKKDSVIKLSENYDSFFQNLELENESRLGSSTYRDFIKLYVNYQAKKDTTIDGKSSVAKSFAQVSKSFKSEKIKSYLHYATMKEGIDFSINDVTPLIEEYKSVQQNPSYLAEVVNAYEKWRPLLRGQKAPAFAYEAVNGKKVSLEDLKGKVVYIDVWATWCGPCLQELPYLEKLQETLKGEKNVVFVSVSVDNTREPWIKMVKEKNMKGTQLWADQNWNSSIVRDYMITGIPRFIIIGKDGNIIDANAQRPSNIEVLKMLTTAVKA
jgi:thiol-disulfide isomerase/thioredoxin